MRSILLTGTIDPSVFNNTMTTLTDAETRLIQYNKAIKWWINKSPFDNVIFIENSGYKFDSNYFSSIAKSKRKNFEFIHGTPYLNETLQQGKSFGEIMLINEALEQSELLKSCDTFYKCTGRLIIKNINSVMKLNYKSNNVFLGIPSDKWIVTWFFSVEKMFYRDVLQDSYKYVDDKNGVFMEHVYYQKLLFERDRIDSFKVYPNVVGISAGTNSKYHSNFLSLFLKNQKIKSGFFGV